MVFKIFASQDATIYSDSNFLNSGMDQILELTKSCSKFHETQSSAARILIKFDDADINNVVNNVIGSSNYSSSLKLYLANAQGLPTDYTVVLNPVYQNWDMGTGRYLNVPTTENGVSWTYRQSNRTSPWLTGSFSGNVTGSFVSGNEGGGNWHSSYEFTQSFGVYSEKDINIDTTSAVHAFVSNVLTNDGFILRLLGSLEFDEDYEFILNYFSRDTNTVYPPVLEFKWDDSSYNVVSSSFSLADSQDIRVSIANNKGEFNDDEKYRFRINVRDLYPSRAFATSSIYTVQQYLPSSSYYSVKDVKTDLTIVDFDQNFTKISADINGSYFDLNMNGFEPERYYKILIKSIIDGSTIVFDDQYFFKVVE